MKLSTILSLLSILLVPTHLAATAVRLDTWQGPDGTHVTVIGDVHLSCNAEIHQRNDLIEYLKTKENAHLAIETLMSAQMLLTN